MTWRDKALGTEEQAPTGRQAHTEMPKSGKLADMMNWVADTDPAATWMPVKKSSHLDAVRRTDASLYVRFKDGRVYRYDGKQDHHDALVNADSPGAYLRQHVRS